MFRYDSTFSRVINKIVDCFYASVLWIIFCIPVVTIGSSTSALYYTVHKAIKGNRGYVWKNFWGAFKDKIGDSIKITIFFVAAFGFIVVDKRMFYDFLTQGSSYGAFYYFFYILQYIIILWAIYVFTYRARFEIDWKSSVRNAIYLSFLNLHWSLLIVGILVAAVVVVSYSPFFAFLFPAVVSFVYDFIFERIFRKIMTPEDLAKEEEYDMERKKR